jgi:hypothetical protein
MAEQSRNESNLAQCSHSRLQIIERHRQFNELKAKRLTGAADQRGSRSEANLRYAAEHGFGVRIDGGDVEALIARTLPRRRSTRRKSFETDFVDGRWFWIEHTVLPNGWVITVGTDISTLKHNEKSLRQAHEAGLRCINLGGLRKGDYLRSRPVVSVQAPPLSSRDHPSVCALVL